MKSEWKTVRISDIACLNQNSFSSNDIWDSINYLDTGNITNNQIDSIQYFNTSKDKIPSRAKRKVKYNSIIFSTVRPNQKHFGIIKKIPEHFLVSTGFTVIDVDPLKANPDYVYFFLTQDNIINSLHAIAEQSVSAYPSIKPSDLGNLEIICPSLKTQNKISNILISISKKIETNNQINKNLLN